MVRDARRRAPHHEGSSFLMVSQHEDHLLPSSREAAGRGRGWGVARHSPKQRFQPIDPPPPTPPRAMRVEGGERPHPRRYAANTPKFFAAFQLRQKSCGIWMCVDPKNAKASLTALENPGTPPTFWLSPTPFTPTGSH